MRLYARAAPSKRDRYAACKDPHEERRMRGLAGTGLPLPHLAPLGTLLATLMIAAAAFRFRLLDRDLSTSTALYAGAVAFVSLTAYITVFRTLGGNVAALALGEWAARNGEHADERRRSDRNRRLHARGRAGGRGARGAIRATTALDRFENYASALSYLGGDSLLRGYPTRYF